MERLAWAGIAAAAGLGLLLFKSAERTGHTGTLIGVMLAVVAFCITVKFLGRFVFWAGKLFLGGFFVGKGAKRSGVFRRDDD